MQQSKPFEQLGDEDQKAAIDVAIAAILIGLRIPSTGKPLYDFLASEFASCRALPANSVRYALRSLGEELYNQDWVMTIKKRDNKIVTEFSPQATGENGQETNIILQ